MSATGQVVGVLEAGMDVGVSEGPVEGAVLADGTLQGNWYHIYRGDLDGWVWEDRLHFGRTFSASLPRVAIATALDNARIWSEPDVRTGQIITTLMAGERVSITGVSVAGAIRADPVVEERGIPFKMAGQPAGSLLTD